MSPHPGRRQFLKNSVGLAALGAFAAVPASTLLAQTPPAIIPPTKIPKPPALAAEQVQAVVGAAHSKLDVVRELVTAVPLLANACWDWGGGDFETPLQAAAHTGRREIAEFLLAHNARLDAFAAAMLGQLDFVRAIVAVDPLAATRPGPHGFTLLHCAKQGGAAAQPVYDFLRAQGVPEVFQRPLPFIWPEGTGPKKS